MPTLKELEETVQRVESTVKRCSDELSFVIKVLTAVTAIGLVGVGTSICVLIAVMSHWHDAEMRVIQGQQIHQTTHVERERNRDDVIETLAKSRIQVRKEGEP